MRKMNKIWALLLAGILTLSLCSISVFAADPDSVQVSLKSSVAPAVKGNIYEVTLCVSDESIGGVQGILTYDATRFQLNESGAITVTSAFAEANRLSEDERTTMIHDNKKGTIQFAMLSDGTSKEWVTFNFLVLGNEGEADFTLSNVKVSNAAGTARIATVTTSDIIKVPVYANAIDVNGASVRTNGTVDIRFEMELDKTFVGANVEKIGFILIPTKFIADGQELTVDASVKYSGYSAAIAERDVKDNDTTVYINLLNSATEKNLNTKYTARAYVRLEGGTVIYSDNIVAQNNIDNGMSSRSCVDVAKAVAASLGIADSDVQSILAKETWTLDDYNKVIAANNAALPSSN